MLNNNINRERRAFDAQTNDSNQISARIRWFAFALLLATTAFSPTGGAQVRTPVVPPSTAPLTPTGGPVGTSASAPSPDAVVAELKAASHRFGVSVDTTKLTMMKPLGSDRVVAAVLDAYKQVDSHPCLTRSTDRQRVFGVTQALPSQVLAIAPGILPPIGGVGLSSGDTWCDGTTMYTFFCFPSPFPGSPAVCQIVPVGSCRGGQSGPFWPRR